jgi:hypothetical protein
MYNNSHRFIDENKYRRSIDLELLAADLCSSGLGLEGLVRVHIYYARQQHEVHVLMYMYVVHAGTLG